MFEILEYLAAFLELVPQENEVQKRWVKVREQMIVHTQAVMPRAIIEATRPNEPEAVKDYRKAIYEPVTQDPINRALDSLSRILLSSNHKIEPSKNIEEYLEEKKFTAKDHRGNSESLVFLLYIVKYILRRDIEDPNGVLTWFPVDPSNPNGMPSEADPTTEIEVEPVYISSNRIVDLTPDVFAFEARVKIVLIDDGTEYVLPAFYVMTRVAIWFVEPVRIEDSEPVYAFSEYYQLAADLDETNAFPFVPAIILGGELAETGDEVSYYQSFYQGYVAPANDCIRNKSDDDAVRVRMNFPIMEEKGQKCTECRGTGFPISKSTGEKISCPSCGGRGVTVSKGPYSTYIAEPPTSSESPQWAERPAVTFLSPDVSILERSNKTWREFLADAEKAVNLTYVDEAQSGKAKEIDREQKYDKLFKISANLFGNIISKSLQIIEAYRVPVAANREKSTVIEPTNFQIKTARDLSGELTDLKEKGAPAPLIVNAMRDLSRKLYNNDQRTQRLLELLIAYDPLLAYNTKEINELRAAGGGIDDAAIARHVHGYSLLTRLSQEPGFDELKADEIFKKVEELLGPLIVKPQPQLEF